MTGVKEKLYEIIFEADTREGKLFDIVLLILILLSVFLVMLESIPGIRQEYHELLIFLEWVITGIFTI